MRVVDRARRRSGMSVVEFALVAPVLLLLIAGVLNYTLALRKSMVVAGAARAGAQYGAQSIPKSLDSAGMQTAAANSAPTVSGITATAARVCKCSDGSAVNCSSNCGFGSKRVYVEVTAQATSPNFFRYPGLPFSGSTSTRVTMRVQ